MECVIFVGIPATGKSTFYQHRFFHTHVRINLDMLKTRHWETLLFNTCLEAKQAVAIDNTNVNVKFRQHYIAPARDAGFMVLIEYFYVTIFLLSVVGNLYFVKHYQDYESVYDLNEVYRQGVSAVHHHLAQTEKGSKQLFARINRKYTVKRPPFERVPHTCLRIHISIVEIPARVKRKTTATNLTAIIKYTDNIFRQKT